jgi:hypothetical protein
MTNRVFGPSLSERYAIDLVAGGAQQLAEAGLRKNGEFPGSNAWVPACRMAQDMAREIVANPESFLAWYRRQGLGR